VDRFDGETQLMAGLQLIIPTTLATPSERYDWTENALQKFLRWSSEEAAKQRGAQAIAAWKAAEFWPRFWPLIEATLAQREVLWRTKDRTWTDPTVPPWVTQRTAIRAKADSDPLLASIIVQDIFAGKTALGAPSDDPAEDYTTYTEVDPHNRYTVAAALITAVGLQRDEDAWVYKDFGAGHFVSGLSHNVDIQVNTLGSASAGVGCCHAVSNYVDDLGYLSTNTKQAMVLWFYGNTAREIRLRDCENNTSDTDIANFAPALNTWYYATFAYSGTAGTCILYSDAGRTTVLDTIAVTIANGRTYQYGIEVNSHNGGITAAISYKVANLDLGEAPAGYIPYPFSRGAYGGLHRLSGGLA
jgi:hypothetical protein